MLGLSEEEEEEEEWSFVLPLPWGVWGEGSEIKGQGAAAPGGQKGNKLVEGQGSGVCKSR